MSEQVPQAGDFHGYLTVTVPIETLRRLQPFSSRRERSAFVRAAIERALDEAEQQAEQGRERAAV